MDKKTIDTTVTSGSSNLITSGAVYTAINESSNGGAFVMISSTSSNYELLYYGPVFEITISMSSVSSFRDIKYFSRSEERVSRINAQSGLAFIVDAQNSSGNIVHKFNCYYANKSSSYETFYKSVKINADSNFTFVNSNYDFVASPNTTFEVDIGRFGVSTDSNFSFATDSIFTLIINTDSYGKIQSAKAKSNFYLYSNRSSDSFSKLKIHPDWSTIRLSQ